jgi:hypothetical protein
MELKELKGEISMMRSMEIETMGMQRSTMVEGDHEGNEKDFLFNHKPHKI